MYANLRKMVRVFTYRILDFQGLVNGRLRSECSDAQVYLYEPFPFANVVWYLFLRSQLVYVL